MVSYDLHTTEIRQGPSQQGQSLEVILAVINARYDGQPYADLSATVVKLLDVLKDGDIGDAGILSVAVILNLHQTHFSNLCYTVFAEN